jgi:hypothetical protein
VQVRFTVGSFDARTDMALGSSRRRVFDALLRAKSWWPQRVRPGAKIVMEPRVGGRFFEDCDDGCGIMLGHVSRLVMPELFAVEGSLGFDGPVTGLWTVRLESAGHQRCVLHGRVQAVGAIDETARADAVARWDSIYAALTHYLDA